jgi:hypothetical protein
VDEEFRRLRESRRSFVSAEPSEQRVKAIGASQWMSSTRILLSSIKPRADSQPGAEASSFPTFIYDTKNTHSDAKKDKRQVQRNQSKNV